MTNIQRGQAPTNRLDGIGLAEVQAAYAASEGDISELIMGEQVHVGGLISSRELAGCAGIRAGTAGVDLCCCTGAGMRYLVRFHDVRHMTGVDATASMIELGEQRTDRDGLSERISFVLADACSTGLPDGSADFVWGEDAWCYVADKPALIAEAARIVRPGGAIACTDWLAGPVRMTAREAERFLRFMTFPGLLDLDEYRRLLEANGCRVEVARDTGRFAPWVDLYRQMITMQFTYDALRLVGFDEERMEALEADRRLTQELAHDGKLIQGMLVARKVEA
jgi:ubiquinone/menaquinone biosynthesis C-methylase UbiE